MNASVSRRNRYINCHCDFISYCFTDNWPGRALDHAFIRIRAHDYSIDADFYVYGVFFGLAVFNRHRNEMHKRLIMLAALVAVTPALARISIGVLGGPNVPLIFVFSTILILIVCFADWRVARRVHPVYL